MESIMKKVMGVMATILLIAILFFALVWHFDGFAAAWQLFFRSNTVPAFLEIAGFGDWLKGMLISVVFACIVEALLGRRLNNKGAHIAIDVAAFLVSLAGYIQIIT